MSRRFGFGWDLDYHERVEEYLDFLREEPPNWEGVDAHEVARFIQEWNRRAGANALSLGINPADPSPLSEAFWRLYEELNP
jgi:hypothetical protein